MKYDYLAIGDSILYGYLLKTKDVWINQLAQEKNLKIRNAGQNGDTTTGMLQRFPLYLNPLPKQIFIMGGVNDFLMGESVEKVLKNLLCMEKIAKENSLPVLFGITHMLDERSEDFWDRSAFYKAVNQKLILLCDELKSKDYPLIDFFSPMKKEWERGNAQNFYIDMIHLNPLGNTFLKNVAIASNCFVC